jgi:Flp pilus assembly pilin Flp
MKIIRQYYCDISGATLVEYAILLTFIALVSLWAVQDLGNTVLMTFRQLSGGFAGS